MFFVSVLRSICFLFFFFFNDTATTEIYTLSLHDALPISRALACHRGLIRWHVDWHGRSEEHTSELQSHHDLVCRLLLEKKKKRYSMIQKRKKKQQKRTTQRANTKN